MSVRTVTPILFFGTDEWRNEGVKDFRPTAASYERAENEAIESAVKQDEPNEEVQTEDPKALTQTDVDSKEIHPSSQTEDEPKTEPTSHPDLDF